MLHLMIERVESLSFLQEHISKEIVMDIMAMLQDQLPNVGMAGVGVWLVFFNGTTVIIKYVIQLNVMINTTIIDKVLGLIPPLHGWVQGKQVDELKKTKTIIDNGIKKIIGK